MTRYVILTWLLIALVLVTPALAGNCHFLYKQHHAQAVAIVQPLYFAGQATQDEALIRKAIRAEAPAIIQGVLQQLQAPAQNLAAPTSGTFSAKCAKCHKGDNALTSDPNTFKAFARMAGLGEGIPNEMRAVIGGLTPQEKGELTEYLLRMPGQSPPPPPPVEDELK
jgi:hypothetical protein